MDHERWDDPVKHSFVVVATSRERREVFAGLGSVAVIEFDCDGTLRNIRLFTAARRQDLYHGGFNQYVCRHAVGSREKTLVDLERWRYRVARMNFVDWINSSPKALQFTRLETAAKLTFRLGPCVLAHDFLCPALAQLNWTASRAVERRT